MADKIVRDLDDISGGVKMYQEWRFENVVV
jgi:hypothetical protein